ncbi:MAG: acetyl-CoA carboxylase carboxyltransferase subunit alpha [Alphaproteobacteria bacterium]|nr:acetyl-CoA carboxylase carboxyltransferase subunit alpha [Alphaproteobacteria bacterium]
MNFLDFEKTIAELESKIEGLRYMEEADGINIADEISRLQNKVNKQISSIYNKLSPWQRTQVARHSDRPHCLDYINKLIEDFTPLAGDRCFGEDRAIIGGLGRFEGRSVVVIGQEKGNDTKTRLEHNFGMAKPEGYRKAIRLMEMADKFNLPVLSFVDTAGAYPGIEAEARGQAEAIAKSIETCLKIKVPLICTIIGEGGSGGAIAIATANTVLMMEHSIYSVISPEGCASILWRSADETKTAANALKITSNDLLSLKIIDEIIPEPLGGAHRDHAAAIANAGKVISKHLDELLVLEPDAIHAHRQEKFLKMTRKDTLDG